MSIKIPGKDEMVRSVGVNPHNYEKLCMMLADDEDQVSEVLAHIGYTLQFGNQLPWKSAAARKKHLEAAELAERLSEMFPERHGPENTEKLRNMARCHRALADMKDPKGKPQPRNMQHVYLAHGLINLIEAGDLSVEPRKSASSELAKLFRLCCAIAGLYPPKNVAHYLGDGVDHIIQKQVVERKKRAVIRLAKHKISGNFKGNFLEALKAIQKGD